MMIMTMVVIIEKSLNLLKNPLVKKECGEVKKKSVLRNGIHCRKLLIGWFMLWYNKMSKLLFYFIRE